MTACVLPHDDPRDAEPGSWTCGRCRSRLRNQCAALPNLANWLQLHIVRTRRAGEPVTGSRETPVPASLDILAMLGLGATHVETVRRRGIGMDTDRDDLPNIYRTAASWARLIFESKPDAEFPAANTLAGISAYLVAHIGWICQQEWVGDMAAEIGDLHAQARKLAPRFAPRKHLRQPCPSCECMALVLEHGDVECEARAGGCGRIWRDGDLDWLGHVLAGGAA